MPAATTACALRVRCYQRGVATAAQTLSYPLTLPGLVAGQPATPYLVQAHLPLAGLPADTYRAELTLLVAGVQQTGSRTYRLDDSPRHRQYIFLNSLGQWDTLSCTGPLSSKASVERTVATRLLPPDYDPQDGPESVAAVTLDGRLTVSTGQVSPGELAYLRELLLSTDVYEVAGDGLRKIRLTTKDLLDYQDDAGADGFSFEYAYCFDTNLYDNARFTNF